MATPGELAALFAAGWSAGGNASIASEHGARLFELWLEAKHAQPSLAEHELVGALARRAPADDLGAYLGRIRAAELALAIAAARGSAAAIAELERTSRATIDATCRKFAGPGHTADDLRQILRAKLFVAEPGRSPKIADYGGQGFLDNWLRVTAVRVFLDLDKRKDRVRETSADDAELLALPQPGDLALDAVKAEYRAAVAAALHTAARALPPGDRHLLRQHLAAGHSIDQLGAVLGIHRATAARRIARAREHLAAETRRLVGEALQLDARELEGVMALVISRLDVSIGKLLATGDQQVGLARTQASDPGLAATQASDPGLARTQATIDAIQLARPEPRR